jgi:peptidoglycan/xylan/chitin deacetylase (PgdA/CDA1 family)
MRLDRALTLGIAGPLSRRTGGTAGAPTRLPILMYHGVTEEDDRHTLAYHGTCTTPRRFAAQMQWLVETGWRGVSVGEALRWGADRNEPKPRPVALTFDDGPADFLTAALPVLRRHGFSATVYLPTAFIGETRRRFQGTECITWSEARALRAEGIELGAHTVTHPRLVELTEDACWRELVDARLEIESQTGGPVREFSYPYAFPSGRPAFVRRLCELLPAAGYAHCATTLIGRAPLGTVPLLLPRLPVNEADDRALFEAKLAGDYDWLGRPQRWLKRVRAAISSPFSA